MKDLLLVDVAIREALSDACCWACRFKPEAEDNDGARRWRDGSLEEDLPMRTLSEMFNVNYFMVSQTNPHIVPALNLKRRVNRKLGNLLEAEWKHRCAACLKLLRHHTLAVLSPGCLTCHHAGAASNAFVLKAPKPTFP